MGMVIVDDKLSREAVQRAREEYDFYIKITADLDHGILVIGGEYHADAERMLIDKYGCINSNIWGGGYNLKTRTFETNAIINLRQPNNPSLEIIDLNIRQKFLKLVAAKLKKIERYL